MAAAQAARLSRWGQTGLGEKFGMLQVCCLDCARYERLRKVRVETLAVHAGHEIDPATGAVAAPIHLSTTFERDVEGTLLARFHVHAQ